jgi:hypothetical protein
MLSIDALSGQLKVQNKTKRERARVCRLAFSTYTPHSKSEKSKEEANVLFTWGVGHHDEIADAGQGPRQVDAKDHEVVEAVVRVVRVVVDVHADEDDVEDQRDLKDFKKGM